MIRPTRTWQLFEQLVVKILEENDFIAIKNDVRGDNGFDLLARYKNEDWAIEVKFYRTARAQYSLIDAAASRLAINGAAAQVQKGMLVVSCIIPSELRVIIQDKFNITLIDQVDLKSWCKNNPSLAEELGTILESTPYESLDVKPVNKNSKSPLTLNSLSLTKTQALDTRGTTLIQELGLIKKGKTSWSEYEKICDKILRYLFSNDLHGWHYQKRTDDGLHRYDYVCRVKPTTEFWKFVIDHLDSRYVLFEFKNYSGKIKQGQVLTTEKYLLERGLRRVAFIITRVGADQNAITMMQGAMREHGKLMLVLNDEKVSEMLKMKEQGEDPSDLLFEIADDFLLRLPR